MDERASRGGTVGVKCGRVVDKTPLPSFGLPDKRLNAGSKVSHVTEVMGKVSLNPSPGAACHGLIRGAQNGNCSTTQSHPALALAAISGDNVVLHILVIGNDCAFDNFSKKASQPDRPPLLDAASAGGMRQRCRRLPP